MLANQADSQYYCLDMNIEQIPEHPRDITLEMMEFLREPAKEKNDHSKSAVLASIAMKAEKAYWSDIATVFKSDLEVDAVLFSPI